MSRIPSDDLYQHVDCKYTGVIVMAKRAREILKNSEKDKVGKPLLRAYDELMNGELEFFHALPEENEEDPLEDNSCGEVSDRNESDHPSL